MNANTVSFCYFLIIFTKVCAPGPRGSFYYLEYNSFFFSSFYVPFFYSFLRFVDKIQMFTKNIGSLNI